MTQHGDVTSPEQDTGQPDSDRAPAAPDLTWPSPYLTEGEAVPEAYPAPAQPGQPGYGSAGQFLRPRPAPGADQPGYHSAYEQRPPATQRPPARHDQVLAAGWERFLASALDWLLILVAAFLPLMSPMLRLWRQLAAVFNQVQGLSQSAAQAAVRNVLQSPANARTLTMFVLLAFAIALAYFWALHAGWGTTLGKRALGLRVVAAAGRSPIGVRAAGLRAVAFLLGPAVLLLAPVGVGLLGGLLWLADGLALLVGSRRQCLHDRLAGTTVIRTRMPG